MLRQLIVNADDFGFTEGVSRGILRGHHEGIVTSTSVMINFPAALDWVSRARQDAPDLGLGLHLVLTAGRPAAPHDRAGGLRGQSGKVGGGEHGGVQFGERRHSV